MNDTHRDPVQHRVRFDFEIEFTNGGGIQGQDFRLDIDGDDIADSALVDYIVRDLRLLMVGQARILNKAVIVEAHKRKADAAEPGRRIYIDLSHTIEDGLITYPGMPAARVCDYLSREASREVYEAGTEFHIARIEMVANTGTYLDCPFHRYEHGHDLARSNPKPSPISTASWCAPTTARSTPSTRPGSATRKSAAARCWCIPAGTRAGPIPATRSGIRS